MNAVRTPFAGASRRSDQYAKRNTGNSSLIELDTIYNEPCLDTMHRMDDESIDLVVTSPPYDDLRKYNGYSFDFDPMPAELYRGC